MEEGRILEKTVKRERAPAPLVTLGRRMREIREKRKYSQVEVARLLGVAKQSSSQWELARIPPQIINLVRFCAVMQVPLKELCGDIEQDIEGYDEVFHRLRATDRVAPVFSDEQSAGVYGMAKNEDRAAPVITRYIAVDDRHGLHDYAFKITGRSMEPRFRIGDEVSILTKPPAEPGHLVHARVGDQFVFRRYLPTRVNSHTGARLKALNEVYPDIIMAEQDQILGIMGTHRSTYHD